MKDTVGRQVTTTSTSRFVSDPDVGYLAVVKVIAVVYVSHINVIIVVPLAPPVFQP
jgi:hypothetical protein